MNYELALELEHNKFPYKEKTFYPMAQPIELIQWLISVRSRGTLVVSIE
jgi:hypothetical protein